MINRLCKRLNQNIEIRQSLSSREFDSYILKNHVVGRINPAFFMSTFLIYSMLFYVIM